MTATRVPGSVYQATDGLWYRWPEPTPYGTEEAALDAPPPTAASTGAPRTTNALAIAALVLGVLWVFGLGSLLAVVLGVVALRQIKRTGEDGRALAIAGVALGAAGLLSLVGLAVVLLFGSSVDRDFESTCRDIAAGVGENADAVCGR